MKYLLDTNVVSEFARSQWDANVFDFLHKIDEENFYLSVVTIAEIQQGISYLKVGNQRSLLETWLSDDVMVRFEGRILDVTVPIAETWGDLMGYAKKSGIGLGAMDAFLAASATVHSLTVATRNLRDFKRLHVNTINPWEPMLRVTSLSRADPAR